MNTPSDAEMAAWYFEHGEALSVLRGAIQAQEVVEAIRYQYAAAHPVEVTVDDVWKRVRGEIEGFQNLTMEQKQDAMLNRLCQREADRLNDKLNQATDVQYDEEELRRRLADCVRCNAYRFLLGDTP